jgi:hypothetical protein
MPMNHRCFLQASLPLFRVCSPPKLSSSIINLPRRALQLSTSTYNFSYCHTFLSYMTQAWGMPSSFVYKFYFPLPRERFGSHSFPSPSDEYLLQLLSPLFLTMVLSVEETLMYFDYTYAPNLTHQGASIITKIPSAVSHENGYRNTTSSNTY